ncbi:hypothetical protein LOK49_LG12G02797 [Camellia lanceoleosa]|uniref:Uncharacterized protein n=1 Tax=Camellia lanceoleosa TaxID=1840588 RepID=A0ACC0FNC3_9ERIC|nr:hypothetical protein LOK49_LG12G02797 [Camellia lanceoleosa]
MGVCMEILRVAARFHSHCPHTARLYYHPPSNSANDHHDDDHHAHNGESERHSRIQEMMTQMPSFGVKATMGFDTTAFIVYSLA